MKKRNMMLLTSMLLAVLIIAGGTFAWFTASTAPIKNEFKAGTLKFKTYECFDKHAAENVNPGDCIGKSVYFQNTGTKRMYVRVKVTPNFDETIANMPINVGWVEHNGYYYYRFPVLPGWFTTPLMNKVCFDGEGMGNEYQGQEMTLQIEPEAVQVTNGASTHVWGVHPWYLGAALRGGEIDPNYVPEDYGPSTEIAPVMDFEGELEVYENN